MHEGRPTPARTSTGGPSAGSPDAFTADDVVAVSFLSVYVPPMAAADLLVRRRDEFSALLSAIGPDRDLVDVTEEINEEWPAWKLYAALRSLPGVGPTIARKLCARKRPRPLPVIDSLVRQVTGSDSHWAPLWDELRADDGRLHDRLLLLRDRAVPKRDVSALRVYDVVTWMEGTSRAGARPATGTAAAIAALTEGEGVIDSASSTTTQADGMA